MAGKVQDFLNCYHPNYQGQLDQAINNKSVYYWVMVDIYCSQLVQYAVWKSGQLERIIELTIHQLTQVAQW